MLRKLFFCVLTILILSFTASAQERQLITYHGQFRTLLSDARLSGSILNNDSLSTKRGALGTMYLDLGIHVTPSEDFKISAEFRMRNAVGQFSNRLTSTSGTILLTGNSLIDTRMIFRQIRAEGNIKKIVQYQIGDINLGLTKYTLINNDEIYCDYESDIFKERRIISDYENLRADNKWRMQGASAKSQINFRRIIKKIDVSAFGTRTMLNNGDGVPDRLVAGGNLNITQSKYVKAGVNFINMFDIPGTSYDSIVLPYDYRNQVLTGDYVITPYNKGDYEINIVGESGVSKNNYFISAKDTTAKKEDFFIDAGLKAFYKPMKLQLAVSYINVGCDFTSPGAQTLSMSSVGASPLYFNKVNNATTVRDLNVFDRLMDETIYNQRLQPGLMPFIPVFGNVLPYGSATPNRSGVVFELGRLKDTSRVITCTVGGAKLSELVAEGDSSGQLRGFTQLKGGLVFNVSKLIKWQKSIVITAGGRYEQTTRSGSAFVDFSSLLADAGIHIEVFRDVFLVGGIKYLQGSGTEVITQRDIFGSISGYTPYLYNVDQYIVSGALKLKLFANSFASIEYNQLSLQNKDVTNSNYTMGNLFINFTIRY